MPPKRKAPAGKKVVKKLRQDSSSKLPNDSRNGFCDNNNMRDKNLGKDFTEHNKEGFPGFTVVKMNTLQLDSSSKESAFETKEFPIMELNQILQKKSRLSFQGSFIWKILQFPSLLKMDLSTKNARQYFGLDLVDEGSGKTFWAHKAKVWENLFETVQDFARKNLCDPINDMFNGILSCPV